LFTLIKVEALALGADGVLPIGGKICAEIAGGIGGGWDGGATVGGTKFDTGAFDACAGLIHHPASDGHLRLEAGTDECDDTPYPHEMESNRHGAARNCLC
jgi:hypothetical protein